MLKLLFKYLPINIFLDILKTTFETILIDINKYYVKAILGENNYEALLDLLAKLDPGLHD